MIVQFRSTDTFPHRWVMPAVDHAGRTGNRIGKNRGAGRGAGAAALAGVALLVFACAPADSTADEEPPPITFKSAEVVARVDSEAIQAGDVTVWAIGEFNKVKSNLPADEYKKAYEDLIKVQIKSLVKIKLLFGDARGNIDESELAETEKRLAAEFDETALDSYMKRSNCATLQDLERKLAPSGSSIARLRRNFVESQIAQQWFQEQFQIDDVRVSSDDARARYEKDLAKYEQPAAALYEELVVKVDRRRNDQRARAALDEMVGQIESGASWSDVAKKRSEGTTSDQGGRQGWIRQGSHRSRAVDKALFSLPVGEISAALKDGDRFYVVQVVERRPAGTTPFAEVEAAIVDQLKQERLIEEQISYMRRLHEQARIWTVFDDSTDAKSRTGRSSPKRPTR